MKDLFFILGARDPEMLEISRVLRAHEVRYGHAVRCFQPVKAATAYDADNVVKDRTGRDGPSAPALIPAGARVVFVECAVRGILPAEVCDHHHAGDPGFEATPSEYMSGSSLGQVLALLELEPTQEQRIIAAADHCLGHAYKGHCPGVSPEDLAAWRAQNRAKRRQVPVAEMQTRIELACRRINRAPKVYVDGYPIAWFPQGSVEPWEEIKEASARLGTAICMVRPQGGRKPKKVTITSAPPAVIREWMRISRQSGLKRIYGSPARGFGGGYVV